VQLFAEHFITSGLVCNPDVHWYGFHTDHDFAYIIRALSNENISDTEDQFIKKLIMFIPNFYDIKVIADACFGTFKSSLACLSDMLQVSRDDNCEHQAGSDSKITAKCFFALQELGDAQKQLT